MKLQHLILLAPIYLCSFPVFAFTLDEGADITDTLNQEISKLSSGGTLSVPAGTYKVDATKSIALKSNISIKLSPKTYLEVIANKNTSYRLFKVHNVKNVTIEGGNLIGDKYTHLDTKGQWGMGVDVKDSQNIKIKNMNISKMWGDAIYIGTSGKNSNYKLTLSNIQMDDNRRQGISITSVNTLLAENLVIKNTSGIGPQNGVDIEPNNNKAILKNIIFRNLLTQNNKGVGFQASLKHYKGSNLPISISLDQHKDTGSAFGMVFSNVTTPVMGLINISNVQYNKNSRANFCFSNWKNNKVMVNVTNINHDIRYQLLADPWCENHYLNKRISIKNATFN